MDLATRHLLLRDRRHWLGARAGLSVARDGTLTLAPVPGAAKALQLGEADPSARTLSGIAAGPNGSVFVADTAHHCVIFIDASCGERFVLGEQGMPGAAPGQFHLPRGLAIDAQALRVADSGNHRVQHLALPGLEPHLAWPVGAAPAALALDTRARLLMVDVAGAGLSRRETSGAVDAAFGAAVAASGQLARPHAVAVSMDQRVYVSDSLLDRVFAFDPNGNFLHILAGPAGWKPGALACDAGRVYVADAASSGILAFESGGALIGALAHWQGPVTALAVAANGALLVKPGLDAAYHLLKADAAFVDRGWLQAGPFDAGDTDAWERVWIEADTPAGTQCYAEIALSGQVAPAPGPGDWMMLPGADALTALISGAGAPARRFLWLRIALASTQASRTPRLVQVRAATASEDYLDHLPFTYRRNDLVAGGGEGQLSRLLKGLRGEFGAIEAWIDDLPRLADPIFTDGRDLSWLASWLTLELPLIRDDDEHRALIARTVRLFDRRGTPASIAAFVELHTGIRPTIVEGFEARHVWVLGVSGRLDFDSQLPPLDAHGWIVPDTQAALACCPIDCAEKEEQGHAGADCGACGDAAELVPAEVAEPEIGRIVVGESGPLAAHQFGLPLFAEDAYRFCVLVDAYRLCHPGTLDELRRIIDREKPAHTDYRVRLLLPDLRVGQQSTVGVDTIVGGDPAGWRLAATLGFDTRLSPHDLATRLGDTVLGDGLTLI